MLKLLDVYYLYPLVRKNISLSIDELHAQANQEILSSIRKNGIVSPSKLSDLVPTNQTAQTTSVHGDICVNYVDLRHATAQERKIAFEAACDEEYLGVYGISLERTHSFQKASNTDLFMQEMQERIKHQVVFVLPPPGYFPITAKPHAAKSSVSLAFYSPKRNDGFSQARGKSLFSGLDFPDCSRVTEIKTNAQFAVKDIIAILVPEYLFQTCQNIFSSTNIELISVPSRNEVLRCLPEMLNKYFNEQLVTPSQICVPDYAQVLTDFSLQKKLTHFSLHAVRLNTQFDFTLRPILNWQKHRHILDLVKAKIAYQNDDGLAWFWLHKKDGHSKVKLIENLTKYLPSKHMKSFLDVNRAAIDNFKQLSMLKGEHEINILYASLHPGQVHFLLKQGIELVKTPYFYMTFCSKKKLPILKQVMDNFETIQQEKAITIQAHFRGYRCQCFFKRYKKAKEEMMLNHQFLLNMTR